MEKSGIQNFWEKLKKFFISKEDAEKQFLTQDNIDIQDIAFKSKNVFGSKNTDNTGSGNTARYLPGLVPSSSLNYTGDKYLRGDGSWHLPFSVVTGQQESQNAQSNYTMKFSGSFSNVRYVEIYEPGGRLAMSATVHPITGELTMVATYQGYISGIDEGSINIFVGMPNLHGKWTYVAYIMDF